MDMVFPIMAEQAFITLLAMVNAGMAGRAGTDVASAVGLVNSVSALATAIFSAIALGGTVAVSRARGAGKRAEADRAAFQCILLAVSAGAAIGATLAAFPVLTVNFLFGPSSEAIRSKAAAYLVWSAAGFPFLAATLAASGVLRGAGNARIPMAANILMNIAAAMAGRIFIFGFAIGGRSVLLPLGAAGAGMALSVARMTGTAIYAAAFARKAGGIDLRNARKTRCVAVRGRFFGDRAATVAVLAVGIPAAIESLAFNGGKLLTSTIVSGLGHSAAASDYLASAAAGLVQVPLSALQIAVPPLVGSALGRGKPAEARAAIGLACFAGSAITLVIVVPGWLFAPAYLGLSTEDGETLAGATAVFRLFCLMTPLFWATSFIVPAGLRGAGDGRYTMLAAIASMWTVRVCLGWFLAVPAGFGLTGIWIAMVADWMVRSALYLPRLRGAALADLSDRVA
ncbi:MAG: hypothetical protein A2001_09225 [Treponema sp. GWC1_61_84]|nr:MAG: hypothetical protein A2001_09225 [Treponema sp. GWC1_61_84]